LNIICTDGDGITDQHEEMMTFWINKIWEFNNEIGTWEDYLYLAWQGVVTNADNIVDPCLQLFINQEEFLSYRDRYIENVVENPKTIKKQNSLNNCMNK